MIEDSKGLDEKYELKNVRIKEPPLYGVWVICEPWFTGSQTLGEPWVLAEPQIKKCVNLVHLILVHNKTV
jgi:hypothetical protein